MPLVSVIIPCYNAEEWIDRCLLSITAQTIGMENLEIILVNDASTDHTLAKLKEWEQKYPEQILVITYEENMRQGGARNIGIQYASGQYIGFVDADDWIEPDMYECLYEPIYHKEYDVVRGKFQYENKVQETVSHSIENREDQIYEFEKINGYYYGEIEFTGNIGVYGGITSGIYKRDLLVDQQIFFPEKIAYEDNYWGEILRLYIKNIYIVDKVLYHYYVNPYSTVNATNAGHQLDRLAVEVAIIEEYKNKGMLEIYRKSLEWNFIQRYYLNTMYILFTRFDVIPDIFEEMKRTVYQYFPDFYKNENMKKANAREQALLKLLMIPKVISQDELERIRRVYLTTF